MTQAFVQKPLCEICGEPVASSQTLVPDSENAIACSDFSCQRLLSQKPIMNAQLFAAQSAFQSKRIKERRAAEAARKQHIAHIEATEARENQQILESIRDQNADLAHAPLHLVPIPSGHVSLSPLENQRIERYAKHLREIIQQAYQQVDGQHPSTEPGNEKPENIATDGLQRISDRMCSLCKGGCCSAGSDNAYLSSDTIKRLLGADTRLSQDAILEKYLLKLPKDSIAGACINQTDSGCVLPKEMRSDICNDYYCDSLRSYQQAMTGKAEPQAILAVQRSNTQWSRFDPEAENSIKCIALVDIESIQEFDVGTDELKQSTTLDCIINSPPVKTDCCVRVINIWPVSLKDFLRQHQ